MKPFAVYRYDDVHILPGQWERMIRPGMFLKIKFEDSRLNEEVGPPQMSPEPASAARKMMEYYRKRKEQR